MKLLPQKIRGYAVALFFVASGIVGIMVMDDKTEQWYQHHKSLVEGCAVATSDVEASIQQKLVSSEFWHDPAVPHDPAPIPYQPIAEIGGGYTSNTSVSVHGLTLTVPMGTSFVSITGPRSLDGVEFISLKKKPLV